MNAVFISSNATKISQTRKTKITTKTIIPFIQFFFQVGEHNIKHLIVTDIIFFRSLQYEISILSFKTQEAYEKIILK